MDTLRAALADKRSVWLGYIGTDGTATERVIDPVDLRDGTVTGFDHRGQKVNTFAIHRITGVAPLDEAVKPPR